VALNLVISSAAITDLDLVEETELSWDQVLEFRRDSDARLKYRRLVRWLDSELRDKPAEDRPSGYSCPAVSIMAPSPAPTSARAPAPAALPN